MKKFIMILAIVAGSFSAFAGEENVSNNVLNAFKQEFKSAGDVQWTSGENFYKASFVYNGQHLAAFYSTEGELLGTTRNISSLDLPITLQTKLRNDFSGYWIADLVEYSTPGGTSYYVTLENADNKKIMQSTGTYWVAYKKLAKI